jgi:tRNA U55 pseudouridine synthase TruB
VQNPEFAELPASYAGRLDPMAEGKLLVLLGEECKKQSEYTKLDKEYEVEVLIGMKTDTGDVLGFASYCGDQEKKHEKKFLSPNETFSFAPSSSAVRGALTSELGSHSRKYPVFSSKTVNGKPLFLYALEGKSSEITIPEHVETIYRIKNLSSRTLNTSELQAHIKELLTTVPRSDEPSKLSGADFRQDAIRTHWEEVFQNVPHREFTVIKIQVVCASGAYMRTLADRIGTSLGTSGLALSIDRKKIGKYVQFGPVDIWTRNF